MVILSLDSASLGCSVCLLHNGQVLSFKEEKMARGQDARLVPMIQDALGEANLSFADITRIAVIKGPGSFTGLRLGLAAARGLGLACEKPVLGINRFDLFRAQFPEKAPLLVVLDSKRDTLFTQMWDETGTAQPCQQLLPDEILGLCQKTPNITCVGDAADKVGVTFLPKTENEALTAAHMAAAADPRDPDFAPKPFYLREPDVTLPNVALRDTCQS